MKNHLYIKTDKALYDYRNQLHNDKIEIVAMDFEGEFNLHQYGEKLCLIQIFDGKRFVIIDPFSISTEELKKTLESRDMTKIFYDASSDKALVFKQYGIRINAVLDLMDLVQLLELQKKGLDSVLESILHLSVVKKKKFQMHNWTLRPVNEEALQYALGDVEHLFPLKDALMQRIIDADLYEDLLIKQITSESEITYSTIPGIKKKKSYKSLSKNHKKIFDGIYTIREKYARELNYPPNNVISNTDLIKLAQNMEDLNISVIHHKIPRKIRTELLHSLMEIKI